MPKTKWLHIGENSHAEAIKALAWDKTLPTDETLAKIARLADQTLQQHAPSRRHLASAARPAPC